MASKFRSKFGYGNYADIDKAIEDGLIDAGDIVVTADTSELVYIKSDKSQQPINTKIKTYDSMDTALLVINTVHFQEGQIISIKNDYGKYELFMIQKDGSKYIVEPVTGNSDNSTYNYLCWQEL